MPFNWGPAHQEVFKQMKKEIVRTPILASYDPKKETVLQTDANFKGLGTCLLQEQRPVYFASKALTETQIGYEAIEIESLAVAGVMEKFHHFLYASHFILETDQKPLEANNDTRSDFLKNRTKIVLDHKLFPRSPTMAFSSVRENVTPTPS